MSLSAIRASGALAQDNMGVFYLYTTVASDPERRKVGWPDYRKDNTDVFIKAQQYLIKYGNLLVKKKLSGRVAVSRLIIPPTCEIIGGSKK